jgi:hypothetical protein
MYGKEETVQFLCLDLLWGQGLYQELRFVLVNHHNRLFILVSTDVTLAATDIIHLYGYRFKIECTFRAIEGFVMCSCIAMGLIQLIALRFSNRVPGLFFRYLRTPSKNIVSEATVTVYLRKSIFRLFAQNPHLSITQIIRSKQDTSDIDDDSLAS